MSAIASNTAQLLEDDPRLKLVSRFLSDVLRIQSVEALAFSMRQDSTVQWLTTMVSSSASSVPLLPRWEITVNLPGVDQKVIFIVEQIWTYQITSVAFFPGWQPSTEAGQ